MRILVAVACLLPFALAAEAAINRHSPEAAVRAAYVADEVSVLGRGDGIMGDNALRARFFSRSLSMTLLFTASLARFSCATRSRCSNDAASACARACAALRLCERSLAARSLAFSSSSVSLGFLTPPVPVRSPRTAAGLEVG